MFQGGGKPRPYPTRSRGTVPSRVGASPCGRPGRSVNAYGGPPHSGGRCSRQGETSVRRCLEERLLQEDYAKGVIHYECRLLSGWSPFVGGTGTIGCVARDEAMMKLKRRLVALEKSITGWLV